MHRVWKLLRDQRAATAVEYALIVAFIVVACIASMMMVGKSTIGTWNYVSSNVSAVM
jgi:pilus assembly protein Flp/PilA